MSKKVYDITMSTSLGKKCGTLTLSASGGSVRGTMNILGNGNEVSGSIAPDGSCELFGSFLTLMRTYEYKAVGVITKNLVELSLTADGEVYSISGKGAL